MASKTDKLKKKKRHRSIRKKVSGTSEQPRLSVFRSARHIYAQLIDDTKGMTIVSSSSKDKDLLEHSGYSGNVEAAKKVGELIGRRAQEKGVKKVVFDRSGYLYHGRVKALAEGARESGLDF